MVALLHPDTSFHPNANRRPKTAGLNRPRLRVVEGGATSSSAGVDHRSTALLVALSIVSLLTLVVGLRLVQGGPPANTWSELQLGAQSSGAFESVVGGEGVGQVIVAGEGDTWWGIAEMVAPNSDTVEVVQVLTAANGGSVLAVGQRVVVPTTIAE